MQRKGIASQLSRRFNAIAPERMADLRGTYAVSPHLIVYVSDEMPTLGHGQVWLDNYAANALADAFARAQEA